MVTDFKKNIKTGMGRSILLHICGVIVFAACVFLTITDINIYQKHREFAAQVSNLQNQIKSIKESSDQLKQGIENSNNTAYIEKVAREELDLQKPGEHVVSFIMPKTKTQDAAVTNKNTIQLWFENSWQWLREIF